MGTYIRKAANTLFSGFVLAIIVAVLAPFFTGLVREWGWYDQPSAKWDAFTAWFRAFATQTWFLCAASALGGLTVGLYLDRLFRRTEVIETGVSREVLEQARDRISDAAAREAAEKRELAKRLDNLHAEGVSSRNALNLIVHPFTPDLTRVDDPRRKFGEWDSRVLDALDNDHITVRERSHFRTLDRFAVLPSTGRDPVKDHLTQMWNEKLDRLRGIINRIGD